jgi:hypothetical protein
MGLAICSETSAFGWYHHDWFGDPAKPFAVRPGYAGISEPIRRWRTIIIVTPTSLSSDFAALQGFPG